MDRPGAGTPQFHSASRIRLAGSLWMRAPIFELDGSEMKYSSGAAPESAVLWPRSQGNAGNICLISHYQPTGGDRMTQC